MEHFSTDDVAEIIGLPRRKLLAFVERGYVSASIQEAAGHGSKRLWSHADLIRCAAVSMALPLLSVKGLRALGRKLAIDENVQDDKYWLVPVDGGEPEVFTRDVDLDSDGNVTGPPYAVVILDETTMRNAMAFVIDFSRVHAAVDAGRVKLK
jgi:hypothetical protein